VSGGGIKLFFSFLRFKHQRKLMSQSQTKNDVVTSIFEMRNAGINAIEHLPEKHFPKARCGFDRLRLSISLLSSHPASERVKKGTLFLQRLPKPFDRFLLNEPVFLVFESNVKLTTTKAKTILKTLLEAESVSNQNNSTNCALTAAKNSGAVTTKADDDDADDDDADDAAADAAADAVDADDADTKEEDDDDNDDNTFAACDDAVDDASDADGCDEENEDDDVYCATDNYSLPADC